MKLKQLNAVSLIIAGLFLFFAFASGESSSNSYSSGPDIENTLEIQKFIKGKWSTSFYEMGTTWYYRFEITDSKLKYWTRFGEWEWNQEPEKIHSYELSQIIRDTYGAKLRSLYIEETSLGLRRGGGVAYESGCLRFNGSRLKKGW